MQKAHPASPGPLLKQTHMAVILPLATGNLLTAGRLEPSGWYRFTSGMDHRDGLGPVTVVRCSNRSCWHLHRLWLGVNLRLNGRYRVRALRRMRAVTGPSAAMDQRVFARGWRRWCERLSVT